VVVLAKESGTDSNENKYDRVEGEPYSVDDKIVITGSEVCTYKNGIAIDYSCVSGTTLKTCITYTGIDWGSVKCNIFGE